MTAANEYPCPTVAQPSALSSQPFKKGWISTFYRHYKGKKLGPYYVRHWKVGNKVRNQYIKPQDLERVRAECEAYRDRKRRGRVIARELYNLLGNLNYIDRMAKRAEKRELSEVDIAFLTRIEREGYKISGRPRARRRRITHRLVSIAGQTTIVKTVFEFDGTTKVFMVPFVLNPREQFERMFENLFANAKKVWLAAQQN